MTSPKSGSSQSSPIQSGNDLRDSGNNSKEKDNKDKTQTSTTNNKAMKKLKSTSANLPASNSNLNRNESTNSEIQEQRLRLPDKTQKAHKKSGFSILAGLSRFLVGEKLPTIEESKQLRETKEYRDAAVQTSELKLNQTSTIAAIATAIDKLKDVRKRAEILEKKKMDDRNYRAKDDKKGIDESKGVQGSDKNGDSYAELTPDSEIIDQDKDDLTSQESDLSNVGPDITELVTPNSHPQSSGNKVQEWRNSQFSQADKDSFLFPPGFVPEIMPEIPDTNSERESEMEETSESSVQTGSFSNIADSVSYDGHASFAQVSSFTTQETSTSISQESQSINDINDISQNNYPNVLAILSRDHQTQTSPNKSGKTNKGRSFDEQSPPLTGRAEPLAIVPSPRHKVTSPSPATPAPPPVPMSSLLKKSTPQAMFQQTIIEDRANCAKCELFEYMLKHGGEEILQDENMHRTFKKHMDYHVQKATQEMKKIYKWAEKISEAEECSNNESYIFPGTTHAHKQREQVKNTRNQSSNTEHHHHHKHNLQQGGNAIERTTSDQIQVTQENGTQHSSSQLDEPNKHHKRCHSKKHDNSHHQNALKTSDIQNHWEVDEDECSSGSSSDSEREKKHAYCSCHQTQGRNNYCYNYCAKRQCNQRQCFYYWDWNSYFDKYRPTSAAPYTCCCKGNNGNDNCVKVKESCHTHKRNGNGETRQFSTHYNSDCDVVSDDDNNGVDDTYNCDDSTETENDDITSLVVRLKCLMSEAIKTLRNDEPGRSNKGRKTNGGESTTGRNETDEKKSANRSGADNKKEPGTALESSSLQTESLTGTGTTGRRHSTLDGDSIMEDLADFLTSFRAKESSSEMKRQQDVKNQPNSSTNKLNKQLYNTQGNTSPDSNESNNVDGINRRDPQVEDIVAQIMTAFCTQCHNQNQDGRDSRDPEATSTTTESTQTIKHAVTHSYFYPITQERRNNNTCCANGASYLHYDCNLNSSRPTSNHYRKTDSAESRQVGNNGSSANEDAFRRHNRQVCYERINMRQSSCFSNERRESMRNLEAQRPRCKPTSSRRPNTAPTPEQRRDDSSIFCCGAFGNNPNSTTISRLCSPHQHAFTYFVPKEKMYWQQCYNS